MKIIRDSFLEIHASINHRIRARTVISSVIRSSDIFLRPSLSFSLLMINENESIRDDRYGEVCSYIHV